MPSIPLITPFVSDGPSRSNIRASTNLTAPLWSGVEALGRGIENVGQEANNFFARAQHAKDSAYLIKSDATLDAAASNFHAWTKTNPDTTSWQDKFDSTVEETKKVLDDGGSQLSPGAKNHLNAQTVAWQTRFGAQYKWQKTQQDLVNASGDVQDGVNAAVVAGNPELVQHYADIAVASGNWTPTHAASQVKSANMVIAKNSAASQIDADPFATDFDSIPNLTPQNKLSAEHAAHNARVDTRGGFQAQLLQMKDNGTLPPDPNDTAAVKEFGGKSVKEMAEHMQVNPKWIDNLYKPAVKFDASTYTSLSTRIGTADITRLANKSDSLKGELIGAVYDAQLPAPIREQLIRDLEQKADLKSEVNSAPAKYGLKKLEQAHATGLYGDWKSIDGLEVKETSSESQAVRQRADTTLANNISQLNDFIAKDPKADQAKVQEFVNKLHTDNGVAAAKKLVAPSFVPKAEDDSARQKRLTELLLRHGRD